LSHDQEVISVAVSNKDGGFIASGELAAKPSIHVWNRKSLECYVVIKGLHA
jgi:WD40 repeat protein